MSKPKIEKLSGTKQHTVYRTKDGKRVPGTTTVLSVLAKPHLVTWANRLGLEGIDSTKYVDKTARIGTLAHTMVEDYLAGKDISPSSYPEYSPEEIDRAENSLISFWSWLENHSLKPILVEHSMVSEKYRYGGTIDLYCELNSKPTLVDLKTGKAIYNEYIIQLAAYQNLLEEAGYPVEEVRILRIGRDDSEGFEERREANLETHWKLFLALLEVYNLKKKIERRGA